MIGCSKMRASTDAEPAERGTEHRGPLHERTPADSARAPVRDGARDLLFEGLEQAGCHDEDHRPETVERRVVEFRELMVREDLEAVRGHARDQQPGADRVGAVGDVGSWRRRRGAGRAKPRVRSLVAEWAGERARDLIDGKVPKGRSYLLARLRLVAGSRRRLTPCGRR